MASLSPRTSCPGIRRAAWPGPGHTRERKPLRIAYVDSLTAPGYQLLGNPRYPRIIEDFQRSFATVRTLPCDLLLTPHPAASGWNYADRNAANHAPIDCPTYAERAARQLERQIGEQRAQPPR